MATVVLRKSFLWCLVDVTGFVLIRTIAFLAQNSFHLNQKSNEQSLRPKTTPIQKTPYLNYKKKEIPIKDEKLSQSEDDALRLTDELLFCTE